MIVLPEPLIVPLVQLNGPEIVTSPLPESVPPERVSDAENCAELAIVRYAPERTKSSAHWRLLMLCVPEEHVIVWLPATSMITSSVGPGIAPVLQLAGVFQSPLVPTQVTGVGGGGAPSVTRAVSDGLLPKTIAWAPNPPQPF